MIYYLPVMILCFLVVIMMIYHIIRTWNSEDKSASKKINEIIYTLVTLAFGIYYPFIIIKLGGSRKGIVLGTAIDEITLLGNIFIFGVMMGIAAWGISAKIRTMKNPELLKEQNNYDFFCKKFLEEYPERSKMQRRITHILPVVTVILIIVLFYFIQGLLGDSWSSYAIFFVIIIGVDFALTFSIEDLIRLFDFSYMPPNAVRMCNAGLTPDELDTFSSTSVMVFSFGPFVFLSFPIFFIILLITSVADAMASIIGIKIGEKKHRFPKSTDKSIEGYVGGFVFTFICTIFGVVFSNFFGLSNWSIELALFLAIILSIVFVLIDIITSKIELQDNYLNPFITGIVIILVLISLNISIF